MSFAPRGSQARRLSVREGGRRVALLVAVASIAGPVTLAPELAGSAPPDACEGTGTGVTAGATTGADGQDAACVPAPGAEQPAGPPSGATEGPATTPEPVPEPAPEPAPDAGDDPAPAEEPGPATAGDPADASSPEQAEDAGPAPAAQEPAATEAPPSTEPAAAGAGAAPAADAPAPARAEGPAAAQSDRGRQGDRDDASPTDRPAARGDRHHGARRPEGRRHRRRQPDADGRAAPALAAHPIPAEWASLEPIVLPPFSLEDFPVPAHLLPLYQAAAAEYGLPWEVLAAINEVETRYGQNMGVSSAGAVGFMQFLPSTWEQWGRDADGDRRRDPANPADAIFSAARYLHAAGASDDLGRAIFAYNHSDAYVAGVIRRARELAGLDADQVTALTERALAEHRELYQVDGSPFFGPGVVDPTPGQVLLMTAAQLTRRVLNDERVDLYACGREDVEAGRVDSRVLATLLFLGESGHRVQVSSLECGHGLMTASGNVSAHSYGAAVDISAVDGTPIAGHQGPGTVTEDVLRRLVHLQGRMRPDQIISLMTIDRATNTLAMADHADHIHVGFPRTVTLPRD